MTKRLIGRKHLAIKMLLGDLPGTDGNRIGSRVFSNADNELGTKSARNRANRPPLCVS
jgi:hypothetical protein